jgi:hypothetical protein
LFKALSKQRADGGDDAGGHSGQKGQINDHRQCGVTVGVLGVDHLILSFVFCRPTILAAPVLVYAGVSPEPVGCFPSASRTYVGELLSMRNKKTSKNDMNFSKGDMCFSQGRYA